MFKSQIVGLALNRRKWPEMGPEWSPGPENRPPGMPRPFPSLWDQSRGPNPPPRSKNCLFGVSRWGHEPPPVVGHVIFENLPCAAFCRLCQEVYILSNCLRPSRHRAFPQPKNLSTSDPKIEPNRSELRLGAPLGVAVEPSWPPVWPRALKTSKM